MSISPFLTQQAGKHARRALSLYRDEDSAALIHAGIAIELLCKALLARVSPALLVNLSNSKGESEAALIAISRLDSDTWNPGDKLPQTLSAGAIIPRLIAVDPKHGLNLKEVEKIREARNSYVHWGHEATGEQLTDLIPRFARAADRLREVIGAEEDWWQNELTFAKQLTVERSAATKHETTAALKRAIDVLAGYASEFQADAPLQSFLNSKSERGITGLTNFVPFFPRDCQICHHRGAYRGYWDVYWDWNYELENGEYVIDGRSAESGTFTAESFECFACGLRLKTPDHLEAAKFAPEEISSSDLSYEYDFRDLIGVASPTDDWDH